MPAKPSQYDSCPSCEGRKSKRAKLCSHCSIEAQSGAPLWQEPYLKSLSLTGNAEYSAVESGGGIEQLERRRRRSARFVERERAALREGVARLEGRLWLMAMGQVKPLSMPMFSATIATLKAVRPDKWDDRARLEITGKDGGPISLGVVAQALAAVEGVRAKEIRVEAPEVKALPEGEKDGEGQDKGG